jgi:hypothetical protein
VGEEAWFGISMTVLVGGTYISGVLARPEHTAKYIDGHVAAALEPETTSLSEEAAVKWKEHLLGPASAESRVRAGREARARIDAMLGEFGEQGIPYEELSSEAKFLVETRHAAAAHFSLMNARVFSSGLATASEIVRVRTASVDAWWLGTLPPFALSDGDVNIG